MINPIYPIILYLNFWIIFSLNFYGAAQVVTIAFMFVFLLYAGSYNNISKNYFNVQRIDLIMIFLVILLFSNIGSFFLYGEFSYLARSFYILAPFIFFFSIRKLKIINYKKIYSFMVGLFLISNLIAIFYLTTFSPAHFKFIPAVSWAFITSNNISYHVTLLSLLLLVFSVCFNYKFKLSLILAIFFSCIHFSKSHLVFLIVSLIVSWFILTKNINKILFIILFYILGMFSYFFDLKGFVDNLDIKPITRVYYGFSELPFLIQVNGWSDGIILFISNVGDETRSSIYLNGFGRINEIGLFSADPSTYNSVFNGRDYHNTILYILYEYGMLGGLFYFLFLFGIIFAIYGVKNISVKFILITAFIYFFFRSLFISADIVWITFYWVLIFYIYYLSKNYARN